MSIDIFRLLQQWLQPLSILWLMLTAAVLWSGWRRRWRSLVAWLLPWTVLTLFSCTSLPSRLVYELEKPWIEAGRATPPLCDAVVCLGGGAEPSLHEFTGIHLGEGGDRLLTAMSVLQGTLAREFVVGGGQYEKAGQYYSEADAVKRWLEEHKLSSIPVTSLGSCVNTHDEALKVAGLCAAREWKQVLLVTSASHMKRAEATFRTAGAPVVCLPCSFQSSEIRLGDLKFLHPPHPHSLALFQIWCHEFAGWHVYQRRGWL